MDKHDVSCLRTFHVTDGGGRGGYKTSSVEAVENFMR